MRFTRLTKDDRGIAIPLFALLAGLAGLIPLSLAGLDFMRYHMVQARIQAAVDASILAVGRRLDTTQAELEKTAETFFWANYDPDYLGSNVDSEVSLIASDPNNVALSKTFSMTVSVKVPLLILGYYSDKSTWDFSVTATAQPSTAGTIELVLALDNSGSMGNDNRLTNAQKAANTLISIVLGSDGANDATCQSGSNTLKTRTRPGVAIGVVPFNGTVNIKQYADWFTLPEGSPTPDYYPIKTQEKVWGGLSKTAWSYDSMKHLPVARYDFDPNKDNWGGCIREETDKPSGISLDAPIIPFASIIKDVCTELYSIGSWCKSHETHWLYDEDKEEDSCTGSPVSFLNEDGLSAKNAVCDMEAHGQTAIFGGILWGWRMLSPTYAETHDWNGPEGYPKDKDDPTNAKAVVLMTDGYNEPDGHSTLLGDYSTKTDLDTALIDTCTEAKKSGITIYTITYGSNTTAKDLMKRCASNPNYYYDAPSGDALKTAFSSIGGTLIRLKLVQ